MFSTVIRSPPDPHRGCHRGTSGAVASYRHRPLEALCRTPDSTDNGTSLAQGFNHDTLRERVADVLR